MSVKQDKVQVSVIVDGKQGISELGKLEMEANDLRHTMQGLKKDSQEYAAAAEQYKQVKARMGELREEIGLAGLTMKQMRQYARELQTELDTTATRGTKRYDELKDKLQEVNGAIARQRQEVAGTASFWSKISTEVKQFGMLAVGALGFQFVTDQISNLITKGSKLSDELADIQKTTGMTKAEVREFNGELSKIDTRTPAAELRAIAAGAGQLGIAKKDVLEFTDATDKLVVSLGDEFQGGAEQVTKEMGALRNIFSDVKSDNVAQDMLHIGNAINELGADGAATGPVVADFANRIGGVGITMGLTSGQVLGLSATLQELNVSTERGGTATVKILQAMAGEPAKFAKVAGLGVKEFANLVNTDLYGALVKVSEGVSKNGAHATELAKILQELGVDGAGASEVMAKLGANTAMLDQKVQLASKSLGNTNSIMSEFETKNNNLAGKLEKLTKQLNSVFTNSAFNAGLEWAVDGLTKLFGLTDEAAELTDQFRAQRDAVQELEQNTVPLVNRYDELMGKTTLNVDEQLELDKIIQQLAETVPTAVTQFDEYGKAIGINSAAVREFTQLQKEMLLVKNEEAIHKNTEQLELYQRKIVAVTAEMNKTFEDGRHFRASSEDDGYTIISDKELRQMAKDLQEFQAKARGFRGVLAELKGEKSEDQLKAESDARWMAYVFGDVKKLKEAADVQIGLLTDIDAKIKALKEKQMGDMSKAEIRADEAAIKELQRRRAELLGEGDDKEAKRREKKMKAEHDAALKNLRDLQAVAMQEQAKLRDVDAAADQQALNQLDSHYNALIEKARQMGEDTKLTEKERREAIATIDLLADSRDEARENLKRQQRQKHAAEDLKLENQLALDRANLRILLAKRNEKADPEEFKQALLAKVVLERDIELQNTKLTEDQKNLIKQAALDKMNGILSDANKKRDDETMRALEKFRERATQLLDGFLNFARSLSEATLQAADNQKNGAVKAAETQQTVAVQAAEKTRDKRLAALEQEKAKGTVTTKQYEAKKAQIQADYEAEKTASNQNFEKSKAAAQEEYDKKAKLAKQEQFEAERAGNIAKITIDTGVAIVKALAEGGPFAGPALATVIGTMAALQIAAVVAQPTPAFAEGGFSANGFTGLEHQNLSQSKGGMLPGKPFLATVNERGPEYFVPHHLLQQPAVAQSVGIIEAIRTGRALSAGAFAAGGYSATPAPSYAAPASAGPTSASGLDQATALRLAVAAEQLTQALANPAPVRAYLVYQDLTDKEQQLAQLKQLNSF
jgi:TP901 family phage tail tape measure protein